MTRAGADADMITSVKAQRAYARGDFSESVRLVEERGLEGGHPGPLLWDGWFDGLTALGYYDVLHRVTGCPEWYAPRRQGASADDVRRQGRESGGFLVLRLFLRSGGKSDDPARSSR